MIRTALISLMILCALGIGAGNSILSAAENTQDVIAELRTQIQELQQEMAALKEMIRPLVEEKLLQQQHERNQQKARERLQKDLEKYTQEQLSEIETLYQVANRNWRTQEAQDSLKKLISQYTEANRTGCAVLYLGQMTEGEESINYLKTAIQDFSDCFYGDGVQVGAYARYVLAYRYNAAEQYQEAKELLDKIEEKYPEATDHQGRPLKNVISELKKEITEKIQK